MTGSFTNTGDIQIAAGAELDANNSTSLFANAGTLQGNGTVRTTNANSALLNNGLLLAGSAGSLGQLSVAGDLTLGATSLLGVDLGAGGLHDLYAIRATGPGCPAGEAPIPQRHQARGVPGVDPAHWLGSSACCPSGRAHAPDRVRQAPGWRIDGITWRPRRGRAPKPSCASPPPAPGCKTLIASLALAATGLASAK